MSSNYWVLKGYNHSDTLHNIHINSAEDSYLYDNDKKKFIDFKSGLWNVSLGYNKELYQNISDAFQEVFNKGIPYVDISSYKHNIYEETADTIRQFVDHDHFKKVIFTNSGSESVELATKIARSVSNNKNSNILSFKESYNGTFYSGLSLSGLNNNITQVYEPKLPNFDLINFPKTETEESDIISYIEKNRDSINCLFLEPILGSAGIKYANISFYNNLINVCKENGIVTIFDEIATGFYKSGTKFFFNQLDQKPDILCLSKAINNGTLPFGTVLINEDIEKQLYNQPSLHFSTQNGNILGMTSVLETLKYLKKYEWEIEQNVENINKCAYEISDNYKVNCRIYGSMIAIPVNKGKLDFVLQQLQSYGILTHLFNDDEAGIILFPNLLMDMNLFSKTFKFVIKTIKKHGL